MSQDRSTAIGGVLGPGPREVAMKVTLSSEHSQDRVFSFNVLRDQLLTPLFSFVAVQNSLTSYERQNGVLTINVTGNMSFGAAGSVAVDDMYSGDNALTLAAAAATGPIGVAATNEFRAMLPESVDLRFKVIERQESSTIERVWLDTTRPKFGGTYTLQVLLRNYRGATETISLPVTMPDQATGPLTLLVSDAPTLTTLEKNDVRPGTPTTLPELITQLNTLRRNNRLYVRLLTSSSGAVVAGHTLPALPSSVRSILDADKSVASAPMSRSIVGTWEQRLDRVVKDRARSPSRSAPASSRLCFRPCRFTLAAIAVFAAGAFCEAWSHILGWWARSPNY